MMAFAVVRQPVANVEMRKLQEVAQVLLELDAVQPSYRPTSVCSDLRAVRRRDGTAQSSDHRRPLPVGQVFRLGRHLTFINAIVNQNPAIPYGAILKIKSQRSQVEVTFRGRAVVAINAVLLEACGDWRWKLIGVQPGRCEQQADEQCEGVFHGLTNPDAFPVPPRGVVFGQSTPLCASQVAFGSNGERRPVVGNRLVFLHAIQSPA